MLRTWLATGYLPPGVKLGFTEEMQRHLFPDIFKYLDRARRAQRERERQEEVRRWRRHRWRMRGRRIRKRAWPLALALATAAATLSAIGSFYFDWRSAR